MKTHARDDEEPEPVAGDDFETFALVTEWERLNCQRDCSFCGQDGHSKEKCPNRLKRHTPEGKWTR